MASEISLPPVGPSPCGVPRVRAAHHFQNQNSRSRSPIVPRSPDKRVLQKAAHHSILQLRQAMCSTLKALQGRTNRRHLPFGNLVDLGHFDENGIPLSENKCFDIFKVSAPLLHGGTPFSTCWKPKTSQTEHRWKNYRSTKTPCQLHFGVLILPASLPLLHPRGTPALTLSPPKNRGYPRLPRAFGKPR